nr:MAG TPA: hypothetical protein [Caudoviricetes sp.]
MPPPSGGILFWNFQAVPRCKFLKFRLYLFRRSVVDLWRSDNINVSRWHILCPCYGYYNTQRAVCQVHLVLHFFKFCFQGIRQRRHKRLCAQFRHFKQNRNYLFCPPSRNNLKKSANSLSCSKS